MNISSIRLNPFGRKRSDCFLENAFAAKKRIGGNVVRDYRYCRKNRVFIALELNKVCEFRLDIEDIFNSIKDIFSKDALMEAGDLCYKKKRKRRKHSIKKDGLTDNDNTNGNVETDTSDQIVTDGKINEHPISIDKSQDTPGINSEMPK